MVNCSGTPSCFFMVLYFVDLGMFSIFLLGGVPEQFCELYVAQCT